MPPCNGGGQRRQADSAVRKRSRNAKRGRARYGSGPPCRSRGGLRAEGSHGVPGLRMEPDRADHGGQRDEREKDEGEPVVARLGPVALEQAAKGRADAERNGG